MKNCTIFSLVPLLILISLHSTAWGESGQAADTAKTSVKSGGKGAESPIPLRLFPDGVQLKTKQTAPDYLLVPKERDDEIDPRKGKYNKYDYILFYDSSEGAHVRDLQLNPTLR